MRDIKFRMWIPDLKMFQHWGFINSGFVGPEGRWAKGYIQEQFTGLKDKNGKEIYEGDIVDDGKGLGMVHFKAPGFIVCNPMGEFWLGSGLCYPETENKLKETIIIGNIHENPELLK